MQLHANPDFAEVALAALPAAAAIANRLCPPPHEGKRAGARYLWRNRTREDRNLGSASLHLGTGAWTDFALPDDPRARGHGLITWVSYPYGVDPDTAERWLGGLLGLTAPDPQAPPEFAPLTEHEQTFSSQITRQIETATPAWQAEPTPIRQDGLPALYTGLRRAHGSPSKVYTYRRADGRTALLTLRWDTP